MKQEDVCSAFSAKQALTIVDDACVPKQLHSSRDWLSNGMTNPSTCEVCGEIPEGFWVKRGSIVKLGKYIYIYINSPNQYPSLDRKVGATNR